jgi:hypothetical protein
MRVPSDAELLGLWELGLGRHPIDRALLLCAWARPDIPVARLAELPLGAVNAALLRLRGAWFGPRIDAVTDCERCGERLEFALDTRAMLASAAAGDERPALEVNGLQFRVPTSGDLAAVAGSGDVDAAATILLERCCVTRPAAASFDFAALMADVEAQFEACDPAALFDLALVCQACGHAWSAPFDVGATLWSEVDIRANALFGEVHALARAYGWTEPDILALSPRRRAAYIGMVSA